MFGLTPGRAARCAEHALVMHPGPMNRGVEMAVDPPSSRLGDPPAGDQRRRRAHGRAVRLSSAGAARALCCVGTDRAETGRSDHTGGARSLASTAGRWSTRPARADVAIDDGVVAAVGVRRRCRRCRRRARAHGCIVSPGFVDLHVHLREPGGRRPRRSRPGPALRRSAGSPPSWRCRTPTRRRTRWASSTSSARWASAPVCARCCRRGCITIGRDGRRTLAPFGELAGAGVRLFTDDGNGVQDPQLMRRALEYALGLDIMLAQHCEVAHLTEGAVMHEGACCSRLGLPGWPAIAEELMVHRDIELCRLTGAPIHLLHLSTARSVELVRAAKADGLPVTAEAAPHHFTLTDTMLGDTTRCSRSTRRCARRRTSPRSRPAWPTARSTRSPPITPRTRPRPRKPRSTKPRPGCSAWRPRWPGARRAGHAVAASSPRCRGSRRAIAGVDDRHGRPIAAGEPANLVRVRPGRSGR